MPEYITSWPVCTLPPSPWWESAGMGAVVFVGVFIALAICDAIRFSRGGSDE